LLFITGLNKFDPQFTYILYMRILIYSLLAVLTLAYSCAEGEVVNVYSSRHYDVDGRLLAMFTEETGIRVNLVKADSDQLVTRLGLEGNRSRADVLITADASRLIQARELGLLQRMDSRLVESSVPAHWRDSELYWTGLTKRVRLIVYDPSRVDPTELSDYEDLTSEKWRGRLLVRSSASHYNQTLMASVIEALGEEKAQEWAEGIVANMAHAPRGNDRDQVKFIASGAGDVAIVNSYYMGLLHVSQNPAERSLARQMKVFFPNQNGRGSHVNISGAGLTASASNIENGTRLIEFMLSTRIQEMIASENFEYPVITEARWPDLMLGWGDFKEDTVSLETLGKHREQSIMIFNHSGWK
jgi:iron(III) transport system substrate-binding protein